jgi:hypothetical protein
MDNDFAELSVTKRVRIEATVFVCLHLMSGPRSRPMYALSSPSFWVRFFSEFRCHHCGGSEGYVSRPRSLFEKYAIRLFMLRMARCGDCYQRSLRPIRVPLLPRPKPMNYDGETMLAGTLSAEHKPAQRETQEETANHRRIA